MTQEQKAARYDETIEVMRNCETDKYGCVIGVKPSDLFQELIEGEDERIRKELISLFQDCIDRVNHPYNESDSRRWIAWLEKQGDYLANFDEAEKEKADFVGDGFIECHADFLDFKEGNTYWLEYIGNDKYNVRSDNLLGKTYHITPCQLYTAFKKLTWLNKQGEQNEQRAVDRLEPKFRQGDWIVWQDKCYKVNDNGCGYELIDQNDVRTSLEYGTVDENAHPWTIADAKDGDVLYTSSTASNEVFIFRGLTIEGYIECYCSYDSEDKYCEGKYHFIGKPTVKMHPATKAQRDLLFRKMKEAGYEWDAEKKELKKIEQKSMSTTDDWIEDYWQHEKVINPYSYDKGEEIQFDHQGFVRFCKKYCKKPAWSEEDEKNLLEIKCLIGSYRAGAAEYRLDSWIDSFKNRVQPKQEWSEEDEDMLYKATAVINRLCAARRECVWSVNTLDKLFYWLKSLKPKTTWKPSDEQM